MRKTATSPLPPRELWPKGPDASAYRTRTCGELRAEHVGEPAELMGFVDHKLSPTSFSLRDERGRTLVIVATGADPEDRRRVADMTPESVVQLRGTVRARMQPDGASPTGAVYVEAAEVQIVGEAEPLPTEFSGRRIGSDDGPLDLGERLRNRTLDLRRPGMQGRLRRRAAFTMAARTYLTEQGFLEVDTPLLTGWSREETSSYLAPATRDRTYALPSTTQRYKQILMAGGVERYFQIARSFRAEERLTPERQPEFSILDIEMAFAGEDDVFAAVEGLLAAAWRAARGEELPVPFPRLTFHEAMLRYGSDRPDLRFALEIQDVTRTALKAAPALAEALGEKATVRAIRIAGQGAALDPAAFARLADEATDLGDVRHVHLVAIGADGPTPGPGAELAGAEVLGALKAAPGDAVVVCAAAHAVWAAELAGRARRLVGEALALAAPGAHAFAWVQRFPFFRYDPRADAWAADRHPFTMPIPQHREWIDDAEKRHGVLTQAFDLVLDGEELGAGSVRVHDLALQNKILDMFGYDDEDEVERRFGSALRAFAHGVPPHAGLAIGLDRLLARIEGTSDLREVVAFPKTGASLDLLLRTPSAAPSAWVARFLGGAG